MKRALFSLLSLLVAFAATAQIIGHSVNVEVSLDHDGWDYQVGETAKFSVRVTRSGTPIHGAVIDYKLGPEMYETTEKHSVTLKDGTLTLTGTMKEPGFLRLTVTSTVDGREYKGVATAGFSPDKIQPTATCPDDFDEFWAKALEEARAAAPLEATRRLLPERSNEKVNVYEVSFQNSRWGSRTYGILCVPTAPGKYPAMYKVPGAGVRPYTGDPWQAAKGCIELEIGVHGVSVTQSQQFYDDLAGGALNCYWNFNTDSRDDDYYKRVIIGAIRGIDFIASLPEWDGENLGVLGSSQGGFLTIACAALDKRVSCYAPVHPALCDHTGSLHGKPCGWPHYFYGQKSPDKDRVAVSAYYDGVNFARRITVPGWFSFGYNDDVVPPTTSWGAYNAVTAPKEIHPYPRTAHFWYQEQYDEWIAWVDRHLGLKK